MDYCKLHCRYLNLSFDLVPEIELRFLRVLRKDDICFEMRFAHEPFSERSNRDFLLSCGPRIAVL